jgi:26S proteasome non-ATPase regulatory subunit 10
MIATPLHSAVQGGQLEDIELVLQSGATKEECFYGESAFHYAAKRGDVRIIKLLLNHGFDIDRKDRYYTGNSPFHLSCRHSCVAAVEFFLSENVDVCVQNNFGETPFHLACEAGNFEIVNLLIVYHRTYGKGADISARSTAGLTPLMYACMDPQMQNGLLKLILDNLPVLSSALSVNRVELLQYAGKI